MHAPTALVLLVLASSPLVATNITVNTKSDPSPDPADGRCSLREALVAADTNTASGAVAGECAAGSASDTIAFSVAGTITLKPARGPLPALGSDGNVTIDGWSAPGAGPGIAPKVSLSGAQIGGAGGAAAGLTLSTGGNVVRGLAIGDFAIGVAIDGDSNRLAGNHVGTNAKGKAARPNTNGIQVSGNANLIGTDGDGVQDSAEMNLISGNLAAGVLLGSVLGCDDNRLAGNRIGTNRGGTAALPNQGDGVLVLGNCVRTILGTDSSGDTFDAGEGNVISGNGLTGVHQVGSDDTVVAGNRIGTNRNGTAAVANAYGVWIDETATGTRIGTDGDGVADAAERNVISGNSEYGVNLRGRDLVVAGNYFGTNAAGTSALPNGQIGVNVDNGAGTGGIAGPVTIGGTGAVFQNVISGNTRDGVAVTNADVTIRCNLVGLDSSGAAPLGNGESGIRRAPGGGTLTVEANRISFNRQGLLVADALAATGNSIADNTVGLDHQAPGTLDVTGNWWGDPSGPFEAAGNPAGQGDEIVIAPGAGALTFNPWLAAAPAPCN